MIKMIISGCSGYMGRVLTRVAASDADVEVVAGFDIVQPNPLPSYPIYTFPHVSIGEVDVIVDFSVPSALGELLPYAVERKVPLVLCTTGYGKEQLKDIEDAALVIPLFRSGNMSLGINLLIDLIKRACTVLGESYDVEIIERHHKRKVDAPSGTALMLAEAAASALPHDEMEYIYERESKREPRKKHEIGISALRGGTIVGEHEVVFAGLDEVIELKHTAASRDVFAVGAVRAAKFLAKINKPGMYNMSDVLM